MVKLQSKIANDVPERVESALNEVAQSGSLEKISSPASGQTTQIKNTVNHCGVDWKEEVLRCLHCGEVIRTVKKRKERKNGTT